jgi:hypothetical protein
VFRQWIEGFEHGHTRDGRRHLRASDSIITRASQWLCNQKLLREVMPGTYETRPRFRIHARDTAAKLSASLHAQAQITDEDVDRAALEAEA